MIFFQLKKLLQIILDPFFLSALLKGAAAGTEHIALLRNFKFGLVVDVGANRGQFALAARRLYPAARILSFEPLAEPARTFRRIFTRDPQVVIYPFALGRSAASATIHVTRDDDSSSLLPVTPLQSGLYPAATEKEIRLVEVRPLTQVIDPDSIPPASLLKIDVQGCELDVLLGCEALLHKFSHLYIECSFVELYAGQALAHQVIAWLGERNFALTAVNNLSFSGDGMAVQGDFMFSRLQKN